MYCKSRKLSAARKRIKEQLLALGWSEHECRYKASSKVDLYRQYNSPHIECSFFWFEDCLKKINPRTEGEAYYALETYSMQMAHLSWRCNLSNPNNHSPLDTFDAFEIARQYMLNGIDFDYSDNDCEPEKGESSQDYSGHIKIIDWERPERNSFEFVEGWSGAMNDGFGWDFVLCINAIPVGAILLQPDEDKPDVAPCRSAWDVVQMEMEDDFQFPVYCHSLIISNGKKILEGDPWKEFEGYNQIDSLADVLQPLYYLEHRIKNIPED